MGSGTCIDCEVGSVAKRDRKNRTITEVCGARCDLRDKAILCFNVHLFGILFLWRGVGALGVSTCACWVVCGVRRDVGCVLGDHKCGDIDVCGRGNDGWCRVHELI